MKKFLLIILCLMFLAIGGCVIGVSFLQHQMAKAPSTLFEGIKKNIKGEIVEDFSESDDTPAPRLTQAATNKQLTRPQKRIQPNDIAFSVPIKRCDVIKGVETNCRMETLSKTYIELGEKLFQEVLAGDTRAVSLDLEIYGVPPDMYRHPKTKENALHLALRKNYFEIADVLLQHGADVNATLDGDPDGAPLLIAFIYAANPRAVQWLLKNHAETDEIRALLYAEKKWEADPTEARREIVKLLKQAGAR